MQKLLDKGAVEPVRDFASPSFYNLLFLVPKRDGGWRPVIDLSQLNRYLVVPSFKMETPASVSGALEQGEWTTSLDLKDAFFHVPIAQTSRKFLRFAFSNQVYQFKALPFGLATAPLVFTRVAQALSAYCHRRAIRIHVYLDDWLLRAHCRRELIRHTQFVLDLCYRLGLIVNLPKSSLLPEQIFVFLGIHFDLISFICRPSEDRWNRLQEILAQFLAQEFMSARQWQVLIGSLVSMDSQVPLGRLHRRPFQHALASRWTRAHGLRAPVRVRPEDRAHLLWWTDRKSVV